MFLSNDNKRVNKHVHEPLALSEPEGLSLVCVVFHYSFLFCDLCHLFYYTKDDNNIMVIISRDKTVRNVFQKPCYQ